MIKLFLLDLVSSCPSVWFLGIYISTKQWSFIQNNNMR